jgi:membrane protein YdbS with pleckstrin-like domain
MEYTISWFWDKIFNTGSIYFYTSGSNFADLKFYSVNSVSEIYEQIWAKVDFFRKDIIGKKEIKLIKTVKPNVMVATLFITVFVSLFASPIIKYYVLVLIPFVIIFSIFVYKRRRYDFYTDRLEYYDGFLTFHKVTVPLERITNIDLMSTMTDRIFGVSTINIETAGSNLSEIIINYVNDGERIVSELKEVLKENGRN